MATNERIAPVDEVQLLRAACCDWRLSRGDLGVFAVILKHANAEWFARPGTRTIADQARLAASNVASRLENLERNGYLKVIRRGQRKCQHYQLLDPPPLRRSAPARKSSGFSKSAPANKSSSENPSAPMDVRPSAPVDVKNLLLSIGTECTYEITSEITGASRLGSSEEEEQKRIREEAQRNSLRAEYQASLATHPKHAEMMAKHWPWLKEAA